LSSGSGSEPSLIVAVDPLVSGEGEASPSLIVLLKNGPSFWQQSGVQKEALVVEGENKLGELQKILYSTESLRKTSDFE
jgi:tRNA (guanine-N(7)-)-methyltransferase subunit TRM82